MTKKERTVGAPLVLTPLVVWPICDLRNHIGRKMAKLSAILERVRKKIKGATDFYWDTSHLFFGKNNNEPLVTFSLSPDTIVLWNKITGRSIGTYRGEVFSVRMVAFIEVAVEMVQKGKDRCNECGKWSSSKRMHPFSFCGVACNRCYDPKQHLPPDTRGD